MFYVWKYFILLKTTKLKFDSKVILLIEELFSKMYLKILINQ